MILNIFNLFLAQYNACVHSELTTPNGLALLQLLDCYAPFIPVTQTLYSPIAAFSAVFQRRDD